MRSGAIDLYPEYTGTGLVSILGMPSDGDRARVLNTVRREFLSRWDLVWTGPLGFENAYEIGLRKDIADAERIRTISDLAAHAPDLRAAFGIEFLNRPDGLPGLSETYGLQFADVKTMQQHLKYEAAGAKAVDVIDVYTTDGHILKYGLVVLEDDRDFFPPYEAAPLVRRATLEAHPGVGVALDLLAGVLDEDHMRRWNLALQEQTITVEQAAQSALEELGVVENQETPLVSHRGKGLGAYLVGERRYLLRKTAEHLGLVAASLLLAIVVAVPLGLLLERRRGGAEWTIRGVGLLQTIPSIALLAFMIPVLGVGARPAIAALFLYSLYPIVRNTYTGVRDADPAAVDAAWALGMTRGQILREIRLPLAAPFVMAGLRTAAVINVGTATLAAFIGAGGLGEPIVSGLQLSDTTIILSGALPAAALALLVDGILGTIERWVRPRGLEVQT
ncbi:MAG: ABC transporter permease subunit [Candidatus Eisenbacteria bacterium]|uniref:ABC transporter permease subunit n=1 Tax=Eiseniibacteriota bacterium TaxID=2212470 RepID=A0A956M152_UNCEI|nr:ABC transporter permease subunit [Candidatus Eisenbacteria bacterium]